MVPAAQRYVAMHAYFGVGLSYDRVIQDGQKEVGERMVH
jgi:hypothetical protein